MFTSFQAETLGMTYSVNTMYTAYSEDSEIQQIQDNPRDSRVGFEGYDLIATTLADSEVTKKKFIFAKGTTSSFLYINGHLIGQDATATVNNWG